MSKTFIDPVIEVIKISNSDVINNSTPVFDLTGGNGAANIGHSPVPGGQRTPIV